MHGTCYRGTVTPTSKGDHPVNTPEQARTVADLAEGLRSLATYVENHPELADDFAYTFGNIGCPITTNARETMGRYAETAPEATIENGIKRCKVSASFGGGVAMDMHASPDAMNANGVDYAPLVVNR